MGEGSSRCQPVFVLGSIHGELLAAGGNWRKASDFPLVAGTRIAMDLIVKQFGINAMYILVQRI